MLVKTKKPAYKFFLQGYIIFLIIGFLFGILQTPALGKVGAQGYPGSFAELIKKAGIKRGDVILQFNDKPIRNSHDLPFVVASTPIGEIVAVEVMRGDQRMNMQVKTEELRGEAEEAPPAEVRPYLGIQVQWITPEMAKNYGLPRTSGVIIVEVDNGSPAAEAGLVAGDTIVEINRQPVKDVKTLNSLLAGVKEGHTIFFLIDRGGTTIFVTLNAKK